MFFCNWDLQACRHCWAQGPSVPASGRIHPQPARRVAYCVLQEEVLTYADVEISRLSFFLEQSLRFARAVKSPALRFEIAGGLVGDLGLHFSVYIIKSIAFDLKAVIHFFKSLLDGCDLRLNI